MLARLSDKKSPCIVNWRLDGIMLFNGPLAGELDKTLMFQVGDATVGCLELFWVMGSPMRLSIQDNPHAAPDPDLVARGWKLVVFTPVHDFWVLYLNTR